jgi:hypothetical protein
LVHAAADTQEAEKAKDEFVLVFALLKLFVVFIIFPQKSCPQFIAQLHTVLPLVHAPANVSSIFVYDIELFKEFEVGHVEHLAG